MAKNVKLGSIAMDRISGFKGIVTARHEYLTCNKVDITPVGLDKDGKPWDARWFDEQSVEVVAEPTMTTRYVDPVDGPTGGPSEMPRRTL